MAYNDTAASPPGTGIQGIVLYPIEPYLVIIVVLLGVGCFQWGSFFHTKINSRRVRSIRDDRSVQSSQRKSSVFDLSLAIINLFRVLAFRKTIGFRSYVFTWTEVFVAVAYTGLLFVWTFIIKSDPDGEPLNWCSRAGLLAASQFPFITLLGTKNNIVSVITHISIDKLNFLHRLAARACLICIGIHALGGGDNFSFYKRASSESETFGIAAAFVFVGLAVVSFRPVRERAYRLFFYFHFIAVLVIMLATILHINFYSTTTFIDYIWPSFIIWAVDRLIRTGRLIYFNLGYFGSRQRHSMLDATTELLSDGLVRVRLRRSDHFRWSPGQFAYLTMPSVSRFPFEAHPFSIASVDSLLFALDTMAEDTHGKELVFFIGVKHGFTRRLKDVVARGESVKVYIDGPYGEGVNLGCYNTSLLIAGGTGITFALPTLLSIVESVKTGTSRCRRVVLVWAIRDAAFLNCVSESLTKAIKFAPPELKVDIQIFLTKNGPSSTTPKGQTDVEAMPSNPFNDQNPFEHPSSSSDQREGLLSTLRSFKVADGRPNLEYMIREEINAASGKIFVSVCGSSAITEVVREALRIPWSSPSSPMNGGPSVTLHVARFGYA